MLGESADELWEQLTEDQLGKVFCNLFFPSFAGFAREVVKGPLTLDWKKRRFAE